MNMYHRTGTVNRKWATPRGNLFSTQVPDFTYVTKIGNHLFYAYIGQNKFTVG